MNIPLHLLSHRLKFLRLHISDPWSRDLALIFNIFHKDSQLHFHIQLEASNVLKF